jgi:acyl carrier protein
MRPVPPGVVGEVHLGGAGVGRGYVDAAALTAERFLPDPYGGPGARLYRTGDLGRWRSNGRLELIGRVDRQVKVRGFRVETAEIEAVLRRYPGIVDAAVALRPGRADGSDPRLVAYPVTRGGEPVPAPALLDHLRQFLPEYMLPAAFVELPELPRTLNGKVDHAALPQPRWEAGSAGPKEAPRTPLERVLAEEFADLLGLAEPAGVHDNFFVLGGHSLTATRLMARIRERYGIDVPVRALFANPTVAGLAQAVGGVESPSYLTESDVDELLGTLTTDEWR